MAWRTTARHGEGRHFTTYIVFGKSLIPGLREFGPRGQMQPGCGITQPRNRTFAEPCTWKSACAAGNSLFLRFGRHKFARVLITAQFHGGKKKVIQPAGRHDRVGDCKWSLWSSIQVPHIHQSIGGNLQMRVVLFALKCQAQG